MSQVPAGARTVAPRSRPRSRRSWLILLGLGCLAVVLAAVACLALSSAGIVELARGLPTAMPTAQLVIGHTYWVGALLPPAGLPSGLVLRDVDVFNKPGSSLSDPSITIVDVVPDATPLTLAGMQDSYCYIEGEYRSPVTDNVRQVQGWIDCGRLLDYQPTPYPTPNRTPQQP
jgi:hypothetical protein